MAQPAMDVEAEFKKAQQMITHGQLADAERVLTRLKTIMAPHPLIHEYMGFIANKQQDLKKAIRHYRKAVKLDPGYAALKTKLAELLVQTGDETEANKLALAVVRKEPNNVTALNLLGYIAGNTNRNDEALSFFEAATEIDAEYFEAWHNFGRFYIGLGQYDDALQALNKANALRPDHCDTLTYIGRAQISLGQLAAARDTLKQALRLTTTATHYASVAIHLAEAFRRAEQRNLALEHLATIKIKLSSYPQADALRATILEEQGQYTEALEIIQALKADAAAKDAPWMPNFVEAQCLLGQDRYEEAATAFANANRQEKRVYKKFSKNKDLFTQYTADATEVYRGVTTEGWPTEGGRDVCFIHGFPRSGTTLIDAILRTHHKVTVAEEANAADTCWRLADRLVPGGRSQFGNMDEAIADQLRQAYWKELSPILSAERLGRTVIDRHATGVLQAGLMKRLFPQAQFVFMLRHPCDAVLSAWMRNFQPSHHTANYLTIQDAAHAYDEMMRLYTTLENGIGLNAMQVRYEDLVTDLRGTVQPLLTALQLDWQDQLEAFHRSENRPNRTASFNQVSKPLYQSATYRFEHFGATLEPVMRVLEPWVEYFGYNERVPG